MNQKFLSRLVLFIGAFFIFLKMNAATFIVTNTSVGGVAGSLYKAINDANTSPGVDIIQFAIPGAGPWIIGMPGSPLPDITDPLTIDGETGIMASCTSPQQIYLDGTNGTGSVLTILGASANGSIIKGLYIYNARAAGISVVNSNNNSILRNVISGNLGCGVYMDGADFNIITGNKIGTNVSGTAAGPGNNQHGIYMYSGCNNNTIGGITSCERNIISANGTVVGAVGSGVSLENNGGVSSGSNTIIGNYIGVDINGTNALGNKEHGITLYGSPNCTIGGNGVGQQNIVSSNSVHGIILQGGSGSTVIKGNFIGTDITGTLARGNGVIGVVIKESGSSVFGGTLSNEGNLVASSLGEAGLLIVASSNIIIKGNYIGTNSADYNLGNGNGSGGGIVIRSEGLGPTINNEIGGTSAAESNRIAYNIGHGIAITDAPSNKNPIRRNSIYCNTLKGIHLNAIGNNNYGRPTITSFTGPNTINGTIPVAGADVQIYLDNSCGTCQGRTYLGTVTPVGTVWSFTHPSITSFINVTATATEPGGGINKNTSEFAVCLGVLPVELIFFEVTSDNNLAVLRWVTSSEKNNKYFEVLKSIDGLSWETIGRVEGAGNSDQQSFYEFKDAASDVSVIYYRLRQKDFNGDESLSEIKVYKKDIVKEVKNIIKLTYEKNNDNNIDLIVLNLENDSFVTEVIVTDNSGRIIFMQSKLVQAGMNTIELDFIASGMYIVRILSDKVRIDGIGK